MRRRHTDHWFRAIVAAFGVLLLLTACSDQPRGRRESRGPDGPPAVPVRVATAAEKAVPVQVWAIGTVEASATVTARPQVSGQLARIHFRPGEEVNEGDLLFTIDPRPFEARRQQAEAALARDLAQLRTARREADRYAELARRDFVSREEYEQRRAQVEALEATLRADRAAVEGVALELQYTSIRSPISGRTGDLQVDEGNIVKANETALVVINRHEPVFVSFAVPQVELPAIRTYQQQHPLAVEAFSPHTGELLGRGQLTFIDHRVDPTTGTIALEATFPNRARALWPGEFVNVVATLTVDARAVVVPSEAVRQGQQGPYAFVVTPDRAVELRSVVVGRTIDQETVVEQGVGPGETVVTDGHLRLFPGARAEVQEEAVRAVERRP